MAQETMRACRIEQVGKNRNGQPRFWCSVHKGSATGKHGIRLETCELAYRYAELNDILDLDFDQWPGGVALWGAVAPVFDTTSMKPEVGIHVHARREFDNTKEIDRTFDAIRIKNRQNLFDESETLITSETAVSYYLSRFMDRGVKHLFCINCGEPHLDAGYFAIKPHRNHLCHACGHTFRDSTKSVSNPIMLLKGQPGIPNAPHEIGRARQKIVLNQAACPGGIQIWASNPAFLWTAQRKEEEGLHVHAYDEQGKYLYDETYNEVELDGVRLNEEHIRYFMAQNALPYLKGRIRSIRCPSCASPYFASGDDAFKLKAKYTCGSCGTEFRPKTGKRRLSVANPFVEIREHLLEGKSVNIRREE